MKLRIYSTIISIALLLVVARSLWVEYFIPRFHEVRREALLNRLAEVSRGVNAQDIPAIGYVTLGMIAVKDREALGVYKVEPHSGRILDSKGYPFEYFVERGKVFIGVRPITSDIRK